MSAALKTRNYAFQALKINTCQPEESLLKAGREIRTFQAGTNQRGSLTSSQHLRRFLRETIQKGGKQSQSQGHRKENTHKRNEQRKARPGSIVSNMIN